MAATFSVLLVRLPYAGLTIANDLDRAGTLPNLTRLQADPRRPAPGRQHSCRKGAEPKRASCPRLQTDCRERVATILVWLSNDRIAVGKSKTCWESSPQLWVAAPSFLRPSRYGRIPSILTLDPQIHDALALCLLLIIKPLCRLCANEHIAFPSHTSQPTPHCQEN